VSSSPPAELAEKWTSYVRTRNDVQICIRPLRPDDRQREIAFINSLSQRSRYFRLFTPFKFLSPHLIDQLMDVDYRRRMAFVATVERDGAEEFVGIARYGETDQPGAAELGVSVTDSLQRCGIARLLVTQLMRFARWRGIGRLTGVVLTDNQPMLALAASLGFHASYDSAQHLIVISRELADIAVETGRG
jgi:RimJ/RimL family protein N-acetyltransferase